MAKSAFIIVVLALTLSAGSARMLLQDDSALPPASNTSLPIPTFTYTLGSQAPTPAQGPSPSLLAQLLAPASAPIASAAEQLLSTGRKLHQMVFAPAPAPMAPAPVPLAATIPILPTPLSATCVTVESLLPTSFASLGSSLGLMDALNILPSDNFTLVVPSNDALTSATTSLAALASDSSALQKVVSQAIILGKDLTLVDGEILATRLENNPLTVSSSGGVVTLKSTYPSSATILSKEKSCTVDVYTVDNILLPAGLTASLG